MSVGAVTSDGNRVYAVTESYGLRRGFALKSKIIDLQEKPVIKMICTGGLDHWLFVKENFRKSFSNIHDVSYEIVRLLDFEMNKTNQAFCLLFAFEKGEPLCIRINRSVGDKESKIEEPVDLTNRIEIIGCSKIAENIKENAEPQLLNNGWKDIPTILNSAFEKQIAMSPPSVDWPIMDPVVHSFIDKE